jgi:hypothetical protein
MWTSRGGVRNGIAISVRKKHATADRVGTMDLRSDVIAFADEVEPVGDLIKISDLAQSSRNAG